MNIPMLTKKPNKIAMLTCPHTGCHTSFLTPFAEKGILLCPDCERSLLVDAPLDIDEINRRSAVYYASGKALLKDFCFILYVPLIAIFMSVVEGDHLYRICLYLFLCYVGYFVFKKYKAYHQEVGGHLKPNNIKLIAGVDSLSDIYQFVEIKTDYVDYQGVLIQSQCDFRNVTLPILYGCPHCTSQMIVKLPQMINWQRSLYEKYNISRPEAVPSCEYSRDTDRYISSDSVLSHIFLCLHCHTHYSWINPETREPVKTARGAPRLYIV